MKVVFCRYGVADFNSPFIKTFKSRRDADNFCRKNNYSQENNYAVLLSEKDFKRMKAEREFLTRRK